MRKIVATADNCPVIDMRNCTMIALNLRDNCMDIDMNEIYCQATSRREPMQGKDLFASSTGNQAPSGRMIHVERRSDKMFGDVGFKKFGVENFKIDPFITFRTIQKITPKCLGLALFCSASLAKAFAMLDQTTPLSAVNSWVIAIFRVRVRACVPACVYVSALLIVSFPSL